MNLIHKCSLLLLPFLWACAGEPELVRKGDAGSKAFCAALVDIRSNPNEHADAPNELIGHTDNLKNLYEVSPDKIADDLLALHNVFAKVRNSEGTDTLEGFQQLTDTKLAGYEGRIAQYAERVCKISDGDTSYKTDPDFEPVSKCSGWPSSGSPLTNNRFPYLLDTSSANYFSTILFSGPFGRKRDGMINIPRGGKITIKGEFPYAKYFAFHPNDMATNNLRSLMDVDIDPDEGSYNPWRAPPQEGKERRYTVHLVFDDIPETPKPNTSYVGAMKKGGTNYATFLIYRVYGADLPSMPPNSAGVNLPSVTVYDENGKKLEHHSECNPYPEGHSPPVDRTKFPAFPLPDHRAQTSKGKFGVKGNFGLDVDLLSNADALYLGSFYGRDHGQIMAIRGKKPNTVDEKKGVFIWSPDKDFRMWSACTYNFWNGAANGCVVDSEIAVDEKGYYTIVVSERKLRPHNATSENGITWIDAGNFLDGQITFRYVPRGSPVLKALKKSITDDSKSSPYHPQTAFCSKAQFESGQFESCIK